MTVALSFITSSGLRVPACLGLSFRFAKEVITKS